MEITHPNHLIPFVLTPHISQLTLPPPHFNSPQIPIQVSNPNRHKHVLLLTLQCTRNVLQSGSPFGAVRELGSGGSLSARRPRCARRRKRIHALPMHEQRDFGGDKPTVPRALLEVGVGMGMGMGVGMGVGGRGQDGSWGMCHLPISHGKMD